MRDPDVGRRTLLRAVGATALASGAASAASAAPGTGRTDRSAEPTGQARGPTVYTGSLLGSLYAADAETGELRWSFDEPSEPVASAPTAVDGTVYFGAGRFDSETGSVYAVDAATGEREWRFTAASLTGVSADPTVVDGVVFVTGYVRESDGGESAALFAVDAETGERLWTYDGLADDPSTAVLADGTVYTSGDAVHAVDATTGTREWTFTPQLGAGDPDVYGGTVYVGGGGEFFALDAASGEVEWRFEGASGGYWSSTLVGDVGLVAPAHDEVLHAFDRASGERRWSFEPPGRVGGPPTVARGTVFLRSHSTFDTDDTSLHAVDAATGEEVWAFEDPPGPTGAAPTVFDGTVFVGADDDADEGYDGALHAVDAASGERAWTFPDPPGITTPPTVVADPAEGHSVDSRVLLRSLGHHHARADRSLDVAFDGNAAVAETEPLGDVRTATSTATGTGEATSTATRERTATGTTDFTRTPRPATPRATEDVAAGTTPTATPTADGPVEPGDLLGASGWLGPGTVAVSLLGPVALGAAALLVDRMGDAGDGSDGDEQDRARD